LCHYS
jgi:gas vesicle protein